MTNKTNCQTSAARRTKTRRAAGVPALTIYGERESNPPQVPSLKKRKGGLKCPPPGEENRYKNIGEPMRVKNGN